MIEHVKADYSTPASITSFLIKTLGPYRTNETVDLTADTTIEQVGIDSFDFVEILFKVEDHYGIDLDFNANLTFADLKTIGDLAAKIATVQNHKIAA